jgi:serine/threonine protein kinase
MEKTRVVENGGSREMIQREISIHRRLQHENIVNLHSSYEDETHFYMVMDYVNKGNLYQIIKMSHGLDEKRAFKYFIQVVAAVHF